MTRALPFTEHSLRRAIAAARKSGLKITSIRPDGTLVVHESMEIATELAPVDDADAVSKWEDVGV